MAFASAHRSIPCPYPLTAPCSVLLETTSQDLLVWPMREWRDRSVGGGGGVVFCSGFAFHSGFLLTMARESTGHLGRNLRSMLG
jgi:hypothetical protein